MQKQFFLLVTVFLVILPNKIPAQLTFTVESGLVFTQYNDVQAPNAEPMPGTRFSLKDDFAETKNPVYFRIEAAYLIADKHIVELTAAPLTVESQTLRRPSVSFAEQSFAENESDADYQFNTYRASYRYRFIDKEKFYLAAGATLLVRDAAITLRTADGVSASDTDLGFVPLLSLDTRFIFNEKLSLALKGDALVGPVGRAEDFFLGFLYRPAPRVGIRAGYRLIEGGADVEQVYNFAFFHFAAAGVQVNLW